MKKYPHWEKISYKLSNEDGKKLDAIKDVRDEYKNWRETSESIDVNNKQGVLEVSEAFNDYKNYIQRERFDIFSAQSQLRSTALEEFQYYLFKDLVDRLVETEEAEQVSVTDFGDQKENELAQSESPYLGKGDNAIQSFSLETADEDIDFGDVIAAGGIDLEINFADHDFVIGRELGLDGTDLTWDLSNADQTFIVPAVIVECKAYFDKPMLRRAMNEASDLTRLLPYRPQFYLMSEYVKHSSIDLAGTDIENLYILRKQKQRDQKDRRKNQDWPDDRNDIDAELVWDFYQRVEDFLTTTWKESEIWKKGKFYD